MAGLEQTCQRPYRSNVRWHSKVATPGIHCLPTVGEGRAVVN